MILESLPDVQDLSREEKRQLAEELLNEVEGGNHDQIRTEIVVALNARLEEYNNDPKSAKPWSMVRKSIGLNGGE